MAARDDTQDPPCWLRLWVTVFLNIAGMQFDSFNNCASQLFTGLPKDGPEARFQNARIQEVSIPEPSIWKSIDRAKNLLGRSWLALSQGLECLVQRFKPSNLPDNMNIMKRAHINLGLKLSIACRFGDGWAIKLAMCVPFAVCAKAPHADYKPS